MGRNKSQVAWWERWNQGCDLVILAPQVMADTRGTLSLPWMRQSAG